MESPCCANICNRANPMLMYRKPIRQAHAPMGLDGDRFGGDELFLIWDWTEIGVEGGQTEIDVGVVTVSVPL